MYAAMYTTALYVASCLFCGLKSVLQPLGNVSVPITHAKNVSATPTAQLETVVEG